MTEILQVGDIVLVNKPTPEEYCLITHPRFQNDYTSWKNLEAYIGQIGCVTEVSTSGFDGRTRVYVNPCNEDTEFLRDKDTLDEEGGFFTTTSHLELVRESPFRSRVMTSGVPRQLIGTLLPTVTTTVPDGLEFYVFVVPCQKDFDFLQDRHALRHVEGFFIAQSQVELVCMSSLRTHKIPVTMGGSLVGLSVPSIASPVPDGVLLYGGGTVPKGCHVSQVGDYVDTIGIEVDSEDGYVGSWRIPYTSLKPSFTTF